MKKLLALALVMALALSLLAACGGGSSSNAPSSNNSTPSGGDNTSGNNNTDAYKSGEWPDNEWTQQALKPSAGTVGNVGTMGAEDKTLYIVMDWTREEAAAYCDEVTAEKFNQNVLAYYKDSTPTTVLLEAENSNGWKIAVSEREIQIYKP